MLTSKWAHISDVMYSSQYLRIARGFKHHIVGPRPLTIPLQVPQRPSNHLGLKDLHYQVETIHDFSKITFIPLVPDDTN